MSIPPGRGVRKAKRGSESGDQITNGQGPVASEGDGIGLTPDEFLSAAVRLIDNGHHPIAIGQKSGDKPAGKAPWHKGVTGYDGVDPHPDRVKEWPANVAARIRDGERGVLNLGVRMPFGGIGIDVDAYDGKRGLQTIAELEARLGALPTTYRITARLYENGSGIKLHRVPEGWSGKAILKTADGKDGHVELIQRHHREAAVPPSWHHTGRRYKVYDERTGMEVPGGVTPRLSRSSWNLRWRSLT
jgi:Bifunctional DNA primase/polymerase, N-terminal